MAYYGLSAAGLISLTLVNRSFTTEALQIDTSKIFQDLSILVGEVERGTMVYIDSPNYALLVRATQTIKSLLDRMISPSHKIAAATGNQPVTIANSEQVADSEDTTWGLWDNNGFQDFEINFWHHLAGHPFLNN